MNMQNIFPTPVALFKYEGLSEEIIKYLTEQKQRPNTGNNSSEDKYILKQKCLYDLTTFIEKCIHEYFMATYCPKNDVKLRITQSWLNWTKPGGYHHKHLHPCSLISGCFYINANTDLDRIYFFKDGYTFLKFPPIEWNLYNSDSWWFPVGTGDLVLFPSSLTHEVQTVQGTDTRISLSFNTFPVGYVGDEEELSALHLEK
jgi:uncharacterized protein (TIGR02466 family)